MRFLILVICLLPVTQCGLKDKLTHKDNHGDSGLQLAGSCQSAGFAKVPTADVSVYYFKYLDLIDRDQDDALAPTDAMLAMRNAGHAVVCRDTNMNITSAELLDYYEARLLRKVTVDFGGNASTGLDYAKLAISRLSKIDPTRASIYQQRLDTFMSESQFLGAGVALKNVTDSFNIIVPQNCEISQVLAQQSDNRFPGDKPFLISGDIWNAFDAISQAGLILHEIIYEEGIDNGQQDSMSARYFNGAVSSSDFASLSLKDYKKLLTIVDLPPLELAGGLLFQLGTVKYYQDSTSPHFGALAVEYLWPFRYNGEAATALVGPPLEGSVVSTQINVDEFYKNGTPARLKSTETYFDFRNGDGECTEINHDNKLFNIKEDGTIED